MAQASLPAKRTATFCQKTYSFWGCWVAANALAEAIGLGTSALLWLAFLFTAEARWGIWLSAVLVVIGSTLLEGTAVGWFQWSILRRVLPSLSFRSWWTATAIGAFIAWTLGMIPSTLMASMRDKHGRTTAGTE